ncbi:HKD family nuclease [Anseongella ginsenosidimutans]|uniref:HKD family nuclease n=1 Tax=Anseongella ginsenosidimutans TaxID=496056 RepID=A0A4R3KYK1_9SPHI|nr:phospholipase D family protein [Anseongella ginsenosidimutans]QEC50971.1 hypothetical protein FRZ59_00450 [Anseongella ginsenosidimutans]TCS90384.1 HKD family nuclease [Anseongella ginsenosidimutans]
MSIRLLGQGFEVKSEFSVGYQLIKFFADEDFHSFTGISAFASQAGIGGLSKDIQAAKKHLKTITIVTGVDQKGTSKEALEELLGLGIRAYIFYQPSVTIFHPKIYLFEGKRRTELIVGSSNLTSQGLFTNVETSLLISIDNSKKVEREIVKQLKEYFKGLFNFKDPNVKKLSKKVIADLIKAGIVPTEEERRAAQDKSGDAKTPEVQRVISKIFPNRATAKIPTAFRGTKKRQPAVTKAKISASDKITLKGELVWESGKLTKRDLNIPEGLKTNPTGSMGFKKGKTRGIDKRHYFRDRVFSRLKWKKDTSPTSSHYERAKAFFNIIINGKDMGKFELMISHDTRTNTRTYTQNNFVTHLSWGVAKQVIAKNSLIGKHALLFTTKKKNEFTLKIE